MAMKKEIDLKLKKLKQFFDIEEILKNDIDQAYVTSYYLVNKIPYSLFHTKEHFVHMGITRGNKYSEEDLYAHVQEIDKLIKEQSVKKVLELATGRGGNSVWLAKNNPNTSFIGIDISSTQLSFANRISKGIENYRTKQGTFEDLSQFEDNSLDLVFIIEALCHSNDTQKVLCEVRRVLRSGGYFVVYDGYRSGKEVPDKVESELMRLLEIGVAVNHFNDYEKFLSTSGKIGLQMETSDDLSLYVLPTMRRFEKKAKMFFGMGLLAKLLLLILPKKFSYNIISGYLFPSLIEAGLFTYKYTLFRKS